MSEIFRSLERALMEIPVIDTHDHLRPAPDLESPMTVPNLFKNTYIARCLRVSDGSANGIGTRSDLEFNEDSWEIVDVIVQKVKLTSYYRWLLRGLIDLYQLPDSELTPRSWEILSSQVPQNYLNPKWMKKVLDRAKVQYVLWDPFWKPGTWVTPDHSILPLLRISSSLIAFDPEARDYEGSNLIQDWAADFDISVHSLGDLEDLIVKIIQKNVEAGCRALKNPIAYGRTLKTRPASRLSAKRVFGTPVSNVSQQDKRIFEDYIIRFYLERARELGLVFQVHTGLARLRDSNPMLLTSLFEEYPEITFDVLHGGYPWIHEVGALAQNYPNVRLNLAWLPLISTEVAINALKEWLQVVPQVDRITWGADCWTVEEMYGSLLGGKYVIARALAELVETGYISESDAIEAAQSILFDAARKIFDLPDR
jgi:hypothetical protein